MQKSMYISNSGNPNLKFQRCNCTSPHFLNIVKNGPKNDYVIYGLYLKSTFSSLSTSTKTLSEVISSLAM